MKTLAQFISEALTKVSGTQKGSNPGGIHVDEHGQKHYVKYYDNPEQAKVEALTGKIYHHMGIHTVNPEMHEKSGIKTKWNDHLENHSLHDVSKKHAHQLGKMYHAAVLTKNWDIVGLEKDNIVHNKKTGDLHAIDHGGAMHFRAQGGHKDYGHDIDEKHSLRDNKLPSGQVFNHAFSKHPTAEHHGLEAVKKIDDKHIHHLFKTSGLKDWKQHHDAFKARKDALLKSYD